VRAGEIDLVVCATRCADVLVRSRGASRAAIVGTREVGHIDLVAYAAGLNAAMVPGAALAGGDARSPGRVRSTSWCALRGVRTGTPVLDEIYNG
jgi:hypothetical protein